MQKIAKYHFLRKSINNELLSKEKKRDTYVLSLKTLINIISSYTIALTLISFVSTTFFIFYQKDRLNR